MASNSSIATPKLRVDCARWVGNTSGRVQLQIVDLRSGCLADSIDVMPRAAIGASGRHLVVLDRNTVQVVGAVPWAHSGAAAPGPSPE